MPLAEIFKKIVVIFSEILKNNFKEILILFLILITIILWQKNQNQIKEIERIKSELKLEETLKNINLGLIDIEKRNKEIYPKILYEINKINNEVKDIRTIRNFLEKNRPIREITYEEFKKMDINQISEYFNTSGFPNTIMGK